MLHTLSQAPITVGSITSAFTATAVDLKGAEGWSLEVIIANATPAAKTFVRATGNNLTVTGHGMTTGLKGQCTTTGALPAGLSTSTDYFVIAIDANTIQLASSLNNALAGTAVTLTDAGSGTNTFTATALAGATVKMQYSDDNANFVDMPSPNGSTNITATGNIMFGDNRPFYRYIRPVFAMTAGQLTVTTAFVAKQ